MRMKLVAGIGIASSIFLSGCNGAACPTIAIPIYSLQVFDVVTGKALCQVDLYDFNTYKNNNQMPHCEASYSTSAGNTEAGDISVTAEGYKITIVKGVRNNKKRHPCFDSFSYTVDVDIYLTPNT